MPTNITAGKQYQVKVNGTIERLFYSSPAFSAGRIRTHENESVSFAGAVMLNEGDSVVLHGQWDKHPKYGAQLKVTSFEFDMRMTAAGLANYLAKHPQIKGIGPSKAKIIADRFGDNFDHYLAEQPELIAITARVPVEVIERLRDEWMRTAAFNQALTWLSAFGLTHHQVSTVTKKYGNSVVAVFKSNPYLLVKEIRGLGFKKVDKVARKLGTSKEDPNRIRAGLKYLVNEKLDSGHCWTEYEELIEQANKLLIIDAFNSRELIENELSALADEGLLAIESSSGRFLVARPDILRMERELLEIFRESSLPNPHFAGIEVIELLVDMHAPSLNEGQRRAVINSLSHGISIISGGPGSGKTYTASSIYKICDERDLKVVLAAPTGKAAKRLEQVVGCEAFTIHRLLGYDGKNFNRDSGNPIAADVIIVDELSMVDIPLAWHLFEAIDLRRTAVIFIGDHNQLPPVGPGNLLRDLLETEIAPAVVLDEIVRQAGVLKENCFSILQGRVPKSAEPDAADFRPWYLIDQYSDVGDIYRLVQELYDYILSDKLGFDLIDDVQLLTPTRKGILGVNLLNAELQRLIQKKLYGVDTPEISPNRRPQLLLHDKIIQRRNNYDLGVMNGTIGRVIETRRGGNLVVDFEGGEVLLDRSKGHLNDVQLAYTLTIHQTQGSEFDCAIVLIHKAHSFMHHRNLFYTGVTRARKSAIILGDRWGIRNCVSKRQQENRRTFISQLAAFEAT